MIERYTPEMIHALGPCEDYTLDRITSLFAGRETVTALDVPGAPIPSSDKIWAIVRMIPRLVVVEIACGCASHVPQKQAGKKAIAVTRRFLCGEATIDDVRKAAAAADTLSSAYAAYSATYYLNNTHTISAASESLLHSADSAMQHYSEREWQVRYARKILRRVDRTGK